MASDGGKKIAVVGGGGAIGNAFLNLLCESKNEVTAMSRTKPKNLPCTATWKPIDILNEAAIKDAAKPTNKENCWDLVVIATGLLHTENIKPEKDWKHISATNMEEIMRVNAIGPALCIKHFAPYLSKERIATIAIISARVGSISDNRLGGWYAYRASKAALNQIIKTASIELARKNEKAVIIGLHPGTVETDLSAPFTANAHVRFTPIQSATYLLDVISKLSKKNSGSIYDWQGERIPE